MTLAPARMLALLLPAALLLGALGSQYVGRLAPCEMCLWQRWPLYGAVALAALAMLARRQVEASRTLAVLAGFSMLASGIIAVKHVGVEHHWWPGPQHCTASYAGHGADVLREILAAPIVQCDVPQWTLLGVSLAGFNAAFSLAGGAAVLVLCLARPR